MKPGDWLMVQGGWFPGQFADKPGGFTLEEWEKINKDIPIAPLRWSLEHLFSVSDETIHQRMKNLGVTAAVHSVAMNLPPTLQPPIRRMQV